MTPSTGRVVVVGGGIAGLTAAHRLTVDGLATQVVLVESAPRLGGKILTAHVDGFVMDAGPDSLLTYRPEAVALATEVGLAGRLQPAAGGTRGTYVLRGGRLHALPDGMNGLVPRHPGPVLRSGLLSPWGKGRIALEYLVPPRRGGLDESLESFATRRLGREAYSRMVEPLAGAIFAADPARLSVQGTLPHLQAAENDHGGLIRAMLAQRRSDVRRASGGSAEPTAPLATFARGMEELVHALVGRLQTVQVHTSTTVTAVQRHDDRYLVHLRGSDGAASSLTADGVILAAPSAEAIVEDLHRDLAQTMRGTEYTSTVTVSLGFRDREVAGRLQGHGYLIPRSEGRAARACTWTSAKFPGHAPDGHALVRVSLGGAGRPVLDDRSDEALLDLARAELRASIGLRADPVVGRVFRWTDVMPVYTVGHRQRVARQDRALASLSGIALAGSGYHGASIPACIASAELAAHRLLRHLEVR